MTKITIFGRFMMTIQKIVGIKWLKRKIRNYKRTELVEDLAAFIEHYYSDFIDASEAHDENFPSPTCPGIDYILKELSSIEQICEMMKKDKYEDLSSAAKEIEWNLSGLSDKLEELREDNTQLRYSTHVWEGLAREFHRDFTKIILKHNLKEI